LFFSEFGDENDRMGVYKNFVKWIIYKKINKILAF
jgi:hypothetical protein